MDKVEIIAGKNNHFIGAYMIKDNTIIDELINFYENNPQKVKKGTTVSGLDKNIKFSFDLSINPKKLQEEEYSCVKKYMQQFQNCWKLYLDEWKESSKDWPKLTIGTFNIQK